MNNAFFSKLKTEINRIVEIIINKIKEKNKKKVKEEYTPRLESREPKYYLRDIKEAEQLRFNVHKLHFYEAEEVDDAMDAVLELLNRQDEIIRDYEKYLSEEEMIRKWEGRD